MSFQICRIKKYLKLEKNNGKIFFYTSFKFQKYIFKKYFKKIKNSIKIAIF